MRLDSVFYRLAYRSGKPAWDGDQPHPDLAKIIEGREPGRALDLGCGTGTDALYLGQRGWEVVGVDFVSGAIDRAIDRARESGSSVSFVCGDVTQLHDSRVDGPFDLIIDVGCYHSIPTDLRDAYVSGVAAVAPPGAELYLAGISHPPAIWRVIGARGVDGEELRRRFGATFELADQHPIRPIGRASNFVLYRLVRIAADGA